MNPDPLHVPEEHWDDPMTPAQGQKVDRRNRDTVFAFGAIVLIVLVASCVAFR